MKLCLIGIHNWSLWSMPKQGYNNFVQHRVCKCCGKQAYRDIYNDQVNVDEEFYNKAVSNTKEQE